jgi:uncharacterized protein
MKKTYTNMETIVILLVIGLLAGILSGFIGVGGGIIMVPALVFFLGMNQHSAQGTTLAMMLLPVGILAVMNYYKSGYVDVKTASILAIAFVAGGFFGSKMAISLPEDTIRRVFGFFILIVAIKMIAGK